jgi:formylglycine-generating enzyme required for sulfatase activity
MRARGLALFFVFSLGFAGCDRSTSNEPPLGPLLVPTNSAMPNDASAAPDVADATDFARDADVDDAGARGPCLADMALLPAGTFMLGESGRKVTVQAFCIDKREVTVAAYTQCVRDKACSPRCLEENRCSAVPVDTEWGDATEDQKASRRCNGGIPGREAHPVNCVSYDEAAAYCKVYGKRLPTEQEWEWVARGGPKAMRYPWGQLDAFADELCWSKLHALRRYKRGSTCAGGSHVLDTTPDGVQDLAGNVSEWVVGTASGRTYSALRGASFWAVDDGYVKAALWGFGSPAKRSEIFGFRCAADVHADGHTNSSDAAR